MSQQRLSSMGTKAIGNMYRNNKIYSGSFSTEKHGTIVSVSHNGKRIAMQAKPIASVAEYDAWIRTRNYHRYEGPYTKAKDGSRLRRIVIMRRQGSTWGECGEAIGVSASTARSWVEFLPFDLAV